MISPVKVWRRQKTIRDLLGKEGVIVSWTTIFTPPTQFKHIAPYIVAMIRLEGSINIMAQIVDYSRTLQKNQRVVVVLRKLRESSPEDVIPYTIASKLI